MRIGVCIPGIGNHVQYLAKCIECIDNQTQKPDIISISISSYNDQPIQIKTTIPVVLQLTSEANGASKNRNIAARNIKDRVDIFLFFDMDDFMHPATIQQTLNYFKKENGDCFLHEFLEYPRTYFHTFEPTTFPWPELSCTLTPHRVQESRDFICGRLYFYALNGQQRFEPANGHLACKVTVWKDIPWPEDHDKLGEDSEYNHRIYKRGYTYMFSDDKLTLYIK
jgi:glycosyltransferase involved in cell wall biosynthesis